MELEYAGVFGTTKLSSLELKPEYRSDRDALVQDFYQPCLQRSISYFRAVGYFTSQSLSAAAQGLAVFVNGGGKMSLIASPFLESEDIVAIGEGYRARHDVISRALIRQIEDVEEAIIQNRLGFLAWLIAEERLEVKIALPLNADGVPKLGLYHEKLGIFIDAHANAVAFTGSANETGSGLVDNFESLDVFWSWDDPQQRVAQKKDNFDRLWRNETAYLSVIDFPDAAREKLLKFKPNKKPTLELLEITEDAFNPRKGAGKKNIENSRHAPDGTPKAIPDIQLRPYQRDAIRSWFSNNGRGTLKMATGSGKTITALSVLQSLYLAQVELRGAVIICPYRHLVVQWEDECKKFGLLPLLLFESSAVWVPKLTAALSHLHTDSKSFLVIITTNATFGTEVFQKRLPRFPERFLIIGDEVHNLGSSTLLRCLPDKFTWRLGLSATPERWYDEEGTEAIFQYFGPVLDPEFTLRDALAQGALVPYKYMPLLVELDDDEADTYCSLTEEIATLWHLLNNDDPPRRLTELLLKRARLIGTARNKLTQLKSLVLSWGCTDHTLFYCGDGSVDQEGSGAIMRQVDAVTQLLGKELNLRVAKYTAENPLDERSELRSRFDSGELQALVAIRCLDEGVDIPSIRTAVILASSTNPRQFIQRRGRVLRRYPGKTVALVYDMIVIPPKSMRELGIERALLRKEFARLVEFADLALNAGEARQTILQLQIKYKLLDM